MVHKARPCIPGHGRDAGDENNLSRRIFLTGIGILYGISGSLNMADLALRIPKIQNQALVEIWSKTADLAVDVAGKVLSRRIDADEHRRLIDTAVAELPAAPEARR